MFLNSDLKWFQSFRLAVLESEPDLARGYAEAALDSIGERLRVPELEQTERQALEAAIRTLYNIRKDDLPLAA
jgi:hypothetical protein